MTSQRYLALLKEFSEAFPGLDAQRFVQSQSLVIDARRFYFSLEKDVDDAAEDMLVLRCEVIRLPHAPCEEIYRLLLRANNLWAGTSGATLGLLDNDWVLLSDSKRIASLDGTGLLSMFASLRQQARVWASELPRRSIQAASSTQPESMAMHLRA